jgi:hypothetical protein
MQLTGPAFGSAWVEVLAAGPATDPKRSATRRGEQMNHHRVSPVRWFLMLLLVTGFLVSGCGSPDRNLEVDYSFEILKKSPDGTVAVLDKVPLQKVKVGDGGGVGRNSTQVKNLTENTATIRATFADETNVTLEVTPKSTKEQFSTKGDYGARITVNEIRTR